MQVFAANGCLADRGGNGKSGPHGAFGVGLPRFRPAKIDQHPVADIAGNEAVKLADRGRDTRLIVADQLAQVFRLETRAREVEPIRSQNITLTCRLSATCSNDWPTLAGATAPGDGPASGASGAARHRA